jgi:plastocyanin
VRIEGGNVELGPFTAPGTYDVYCVLHPGMNLTVIVQ